MIRTVTFSNSTEIVRRFSKHSALVLFTSLMVPVSCFLALYACFHIPFLQALSFLLFSSLVLYPSTVARYSPTPSPHCVLGDSSLSNASNSFTSLQVHPPPTPTSVSKRVEGSTPLSTFFCEHFASFSLCATVLSSTVL